VPWAFTVPIKITKLSVPVEGDNPAPRQVAHLMERALESTILG
jgi:hypothetical protein